MVMMRFCDAARDYLGHIKHERGLSEATYYSYQSALRAFEKWLIGNGYPDPDLSCFTTSVLRRYLYSLTGRGLRPRTVRGYFAAFRALALFLVDNGVLAETPLKGITLPKKDSPNRATVSDEEVLELLRACERLRNPARGAGPLSARIADLVRPARGRGDQFEVPTHLVRGAHPYC
jgi:site-specific recombinase XerD